MKNRFIRLCLALLFILELSFTSKAEEAHWVVPIEWSTFDLSPLEGEFADDVRKILLNTNKYGLNKSWNEVRGYAAQTTPYLDLGGNTEHFVRPVSHEAFAIAISLKLNVYDPQYIGVSKAEAINRTTRMINSLAYHHKVNCGSKGWGDQWQSALWAGQAAQAAWIMWEYLTPENRELISKMTIYEADRFINYTVPYYRDLTGNVLTKGDSKAEENAWNSNILTIATAMMPKHPHYKQWIDKSIELQLSAYAAPSDTKSKQKVNGFTLNKILKGSNMESDGIVINHHIIHPDYMVAIMFNITNIWNYSLAKQKSPIASLFNADKIYYALVDLQVKDGNTMYVKTPDGKASSQMYYPQGNDWGGKRQACYWLLDIMADIFSFDNEVSIKGLEWAKERNKEMLYMQGRDSSGQYYQGKIEDRFKTREEWLAQHAAFAYLGLWMQKHKLHHLTNKKIK
jgi:hypothetical protein